MRIGCVACISIILFWMGGAPASAQLKKGRFSTTGVSISELLFKVAQLKRFWRKEGLDVEVILIRGAVEMQALLGGSVDYTSASGSTIAAAVRGLPSKLVFISSKTLGGTVKEVPPSQVFNFSFAQKAAR
jgi:ABC-type nitrate/sulfonate/bicarbonate transport system substrate-binding protein